MSEATMIELIQRALERAGIDDEVVAVGQFNPRGHVGGLFAGGLAGGDAGDRLGSLGGGIGMAADAAGQLSSDLGADGRGLPVDLRLAVAEDEPTAATQREGVSEVSSNLSAGRMVADPVEHHDQLGVVVDDVA
jgi:hypothetical protein